MSATDVIGFVMDRSRIIVSWVQANEELLGQLGVASLVFLALTMVALPIVVAKLPEDYFIRNRRETAHRARKYPLWWGFVAILKNLLGIALILAGLAMLILPGQGILTILVGLAITNFPGKFAIERRIVTRPAIGTALNRIRKLSGQPPLTLPAHDT